MQDEPTVRRCCRCKQDKPLAEFNLRDKARGWYQSRCKDCHRIAMMESRRRHPETQRALYLRNREKNVARNKAWRENNPERWSELRRRQRARYFARDWPDGSIRARLTRTRLPFDDDAVAYCVGLLGDPCSYCGGPGGQIDHIVPITRGGTNDWSNLTASCKRCNQRKNDRSMLDAVVRGTMLAEMENWSTRWEAAA